VIVKIRGVMTVVGSVVLSVELAVSVEVVSVNRAVLVKSFK
jgi:hypothetical protein